MLRMDISRMGGGKWYSLVDSLRTSLAQSGQNLEIDMEGVGELVGLVGKNNSGRFGHS
jgi:hypothetical protein